VSRRAPVAPGSCCRSGARPRSRIADWLLAAKAREGVWVYGAEAEGAVRYDKPDYSGRVVLVLGSEGRGLRPRVAETCDELIHLPVHGKVGSLNVATAAAALVYGILQLRGGRLDKAP
jgi:23S rRNA (guanosine2251-2'-O)-methyltransferase